jgi:YD repeat-containing protein
LAIDPNSLVTTGVDAGLNNQIAPIGPDAGAIRFTHDSAGNPITRTDARNVVAMMSYNALNRLTEAAYAGGSGGGFGTDYGSSFRYDDYPPGKTTCAGLGSHPIGRLTQMSNHSGTTTYCSDLRGNVIRKRQAGQGPVVTLSYPPTSHRVSVAGVSRSYDANGITTTRGSESLFHGDHNPLVSWSSAFGMSNASYQHNARGGRVMKTSLIGQMSLIGDELPPNCLAVQVKSVQSFPYDESGRLIRDQSDLCVARPTNLEFVWLDDQPLAVIDADPNLPTPQLAWPDKSPLSFLLQERLGVDTGLLEDGAQGALGHVAGMIGDGGVAIRRRVEPDLVAARGLAMKLKAKLLEALDDLAIAKARQRPHQVDTISG